MLQALQVLGTGNLAFSQCFLNNNPIRLMHESAIGGHGQLLPRCRSNIGIGNAIVGSFLLVLNSMALYAIWNMLCNLIPE